MPSGPEGDQGISEHTLMHPKFKRLDFTLVSSCHKYHRIFFLFGFWFAFRLTQTYSSVLFLASFCIIVIYCTCNELISTVI